MEKEVEIQLPKLGESIVSATVVQWLKQEGDFIALDEALLEVSTDKVNSEIPSPVAGFLKKILVDLNEEVEVGASLAIIVVNSSGEKPVVPQSTVAQESVKSSDLSMKGFFSPALLQMARASGVSLSELEQISGSGEGGRITKKDLEVYLQQRSKQADSIKESPSCDALSLSSSSTSSKVKMTGLRKAIADNMKRSYTEVPHATIVNELDVTRLMKLIQEHKEAFWQNYQTKLTITSFIIKALANAVAKHPLVNASVDHDTILIKHAVNVGIAVGVEHGVIVPVIKQCETKDLVAIAKAVADLSQRARSGKLEHQEVQEGTITMTNFGMGGARTGFPIIRHPEVAIIGIGAIEKRLKVLEGDLLAIRQLVDLTFSFDHRVIDGLYASAFLNTFVKELETLTATFDI